MGIFTLYADDASTQIAETSQASLDDALFILGNQFGMEFSVIEDNVDSKLYLIDDHRTQFTNPAIRVYARPRS